MRLSLGLIDDKMWTQVEIMLTLKHPQLFSQSNILFLLTLIFDSCRYSKRLKAGIFAVLHNASRGFVLHTVDYDIHAYTYHCICLCDIYFHNLHGWTDGNVHIYIAR